MTADLLWLLLAIVFVAAPVYWALRHFTERWYYDPLRFAWRNEWPPPWLDIIESPWMPPGRLLVMDREQLVQTFGIEPGEMRLVTKEDIFAAGNIRFEEQVRLVVKNPRTK